MLTPKPSQTATPLTAASSTVQELLGLGGVRAFGICGLGGTGKSTICRKVAEQYAPNALIIETDWYLALPSSARKRSILTALDKHDIEELNRWSDPSAWYDWEAFVQDIDRLRQTGKLHLNSAWRQSTGEKDLVVELQISDPPRTVILIDGIYLLHEPIRRLLDCVMVIEDSSDNARKRAEARDLHRAEGDYLAFKARLAESFDVPYFERLSALADIRVRVV